MDFSSVSNTQISVRIQSNNVMVDTAVQVQVVITATTMARVTSSGDDWTYLVPGRVGDVQPSVGQSGTRVTITGKKTHFRVTFLLTMCVQWNPSIRTPL